MHGALDAEVRKLQTEASKAGRSQLDGTILERHGFAQIALSPAGTEDVADLSRSGRTALWLGAEGPGLPAATMARMRTARIAMSEEFDSLNVATAGAIALHRLWRAR